MLVFLILQLTTNYWINKEINENLRARINYGALLTQLHVKAPLLNTRKVLHTATKFKNSSHHRPAGQSSSLTIPYLLDSAQHP